MVWHSVNTPRSGTLRSLCDLAPWDYSTSNLHQSGIALCDLGTLQSTWTFCEAQHSGHHQSKTASCDLDTPRSTWTLCESQHSGHHQSEIAFYDLGTPRPTWTLANRNTLGTLRLIAELHEHQRAAASNLIHRQLRLLLPHRSHTTKENTKVKQILLLH